MLCKSKLCNQKRLTGRNRSNAVGITKYGHNEQGMVLKVRKLIPKTKNFSPKLVLCEESDFYKDKSRKLEIQLNQSVASERVLNENLMSLEAEIENLRMIF